MTSGLNIRVTPNDVVIDINETVEEVDVVELLNFNEDMIEELLETHAGTQAYWESLAIRLKKRQESFDNEFVKKWWAHHRLYARYIMNSYGERKPTKEALNDMVVLVFSEDASASVRLKYMEIAWKTCLKSDKFVGGKKEFENNMFKYISIDQPWYFESVIRTQNKLQEDSDIVKVFAEKLTARSFHMKDYLELLKAKRYNIGPTSVSEKDMMGETSERKN